jgi:hypothetical protein
MPLETHKLCRRAVRRVVSCFAGAGLFLAAGCQTAQQVKQQASVQFYKVVEDSPQQPYDRVNPVPIQTDPAMEARDWPKMEAVYPNFSTTAGYTETRFLARPQKCPYASGLMETPIFVMNCLLIPVEMIKVCPLAQLEATSLYLPPTYTANPPAEPRGRNDYSGGTGIGYTTAPGRAAPFPNQ